MPTIEEYRVRYFSSFFTMRRLMQAAEEALVHGMPEAHDALILAAGFYRVKFDAIKQDAMKAYPAEYGKAFILYPETKS